MPGTAESVRWAMRPHRHPTRWTGSAGACAAGRACLRSASGGAQRVVNARPPNALGFNRGAPCRAQPGTGAPSVASPCWAAPSAEAVVHIPGRWICTSSRARLHARRAFARRLAVLGRSPVFCSNRRANSLTVGVLRSRSVGHSFFSAGLSKTEPTKCCLSASLLRAVLARAVTPPREA
jgi:hypothetical protein